MASDKTHEDLVFAELSTAIADFISVQFQAIVVSMSHLIRNECVEIVEVKLADLR